jgi:hypothetical protein
MNQYMIRFCCLLGFSLLLGLPTISAQEKNVWSTLAMMKYERQYAENDGIGGNAGQTGRFRPLIEKLDGTEIELKGYIIPLSGKKAQSHFMFSAYPYNMCFFCGKAGPESVMEVVMQEGKQAEYSEKAVWLKGIFKFMPADPNEIMYKLEHAEVVKK